MDWIELNTTSLLDAQDLVIVAPNRTIRSPRMAPRTTLENLPPWLILMGSLAAIGPLAIDMYLPSFPAIAADLGVAQGLVEQTVASYLLGLALAQLCYGPLADRYGRKIPLLGGLALF